MRCGLWFLCGALCLSCLASAAAHADDAAPAKEAPAAKADEKPAGQPGATEKPAAAPEEPVNFDDLFAVPDTQDPAALLAFLKKVEAFRPKSLKQFLAFRERFNSTVPDVAKRILELEKDAAAPAHQKATQVLFMFRVAKIEDLSPAERKTLLDEIVQFLGGHDPKPEDLMLASRTAGALEQTEQYDLAAEAYHMFAKVFSEAKDDKLKERGASFSAAARRMELPGHELVLKGNTADGQPFDWASYRGHVVLVDFWATWCGPCRAELPNVKKNYRLYHDKGFDVVGVSLDSKDAALHEFLEKEKLPWKTLYEPGSGWKNTNALYYGVMSIPCVILVNKEGKVISLNARGEALGELLAKELGPVEEPKDDTKHEPGTDEKSSAKAKPTAEPAVTP